MWFDLQDRMLSSLRSECRDYSHALVHPSSVLFLMLSRVILIQVLDIYSLINS